MKEHIKRLTRYDQLRALYEDYERWLLPAALLVGVVVDFITFRSIEIDTAFVLLTVHAVLAGTSIAYVNLYGVGRVPKNKVTRYVRLASPLVMQFSFGALLGASFIFYWFSGSLSVSWPLMLLLAFLMVSNETLRDYYREPVVQVGVYYFVLLSFFILALPYALNSISAWTFVLSGLLSLVVIWLYVTVLSRTLKRFRKRRANMALVVASIFGIMNLFYFLNIIPPIPLSLTEAGVYHSVERQSNGYVVEDERRGLVDRFLPGTTIHILPSDQVAVLTSIFAPANLNTRIVHSWQYHNPVTGKWEQRDELSFGIAGGRQEGYRGYSRKSRMDPGRWRVDVETTRGQVLGRVTFTVEHVEDLPELFLELK